MTCSPVVSSKLIYALALAMLLAWVGHTAAVLVGVETGHPGVAASEANHGHSHDLAPITACTLCVDHQHPPMTADHVHETPYLVTLLDLRMPLFGEVSPSSSRHQLPENPIDLIERPPRHGLVL